MEVDEYQIKETNALNSPFTDQNFEPISEQKEKKNFKLRSNQNLNELNKEDLLHSDTRNNLNKPVIKDHTSTSCFENDNIKKDYLNFTDHLDRPVPTPPKMVKLALQDEQVKKENQQSQQQYKHQQKQQAPQHLLKQQLLQQEDKNQHKQLQHQITKQQQNKKYEKQQIQCKSFQQQKIPQQQQNVYQQDPQQVQLQLQQHQQKQQQTNSWSPEPIKFNRNLIKLAQVNKPQITSCERVNFSDGQLQFNESKEREVPAKALTSSVAQKEVPRMSHENNRCLSPTSMMSSTMADPQAFPDNISAILGSEITEPGGSFELVRRLYGDSDMNSDDGDFNYEKMVEKFCSPLQLNSRNRSDNENSMNNNNHTAMNIDHETTNLCSTEPNDNNFIFGQFIQDKTNNKKSDRLF